MTEEAVRVFISYSHRDEKLREQLDKHLAPLKMQKVVKAWHDRQIGAGDEWANQIDENLNKADIILLLVSPDFIHSDYCSKIELSQALKRHEVGEAIVVPIILEPCDWSWLPFAKLQAFPKDGKAITSWTNHNEAFLDVATGIRKVAQELFEKRKLLAEQKQAKLNNYKELVQAFLSDGEISPLEQKRLEDRRKELGLTIEEAKEIQNHLYEPYSKYQENIGYYKENLRYLIENVNYPLTEKDTKDLEALHKDLGLKDEDADRITKEILEQAELEYQAKQKQSDEIERQQEQEQRQQQKRQEYEVNLERYRQEFSRAVQAEYPLSQYVLEATQNFQKQLGIKEEDVTRIEQPILEAAEAKLSERLKSSAAPTITQNYVEQRQQLKVGGDQHPKNLQIQDPIDTSTLVVKEEQPKDERERNEPDSLTSSRGVDYTTLRDLLRSERWKEADVETSIVMLSVVGRLSEGSIRVEDIMQFPCADLRTIDQLWVKYSNGKFGFNVQQKIWYEAKEDYGVFGERVGWRVGAFPAEWLSYDKHTFCLSAPEGHLPIIFRTPVWIDNFSESVSGSWMLKGFGTGTKRNAMATAFKVWASLFYRTKVCQQQY
jgi:hypothetical protein